VVRPAQTVLRFGLLVEFVCLCVLVMSTNDCQEFAPRVDGVGGVLIRGCFLRGWARTGDDKRGWPETIFGALAVLRNEFRSFGPQTGAEFSWFVLSV
jgi:hypothetical protein